MHECTSSQLKNKTFFGGYKKPSMLKVWNTWLFAAAILSIVYDNARKRKELQLIRFVIKVVLRDHWCENTGKQVSVNVDIG